MPSKDNRYGFTIVELLVVIVVIAILASITVVAYNGIQHRATTSLALNDLSIIRKKLEMYNIDNGSYPPNSSTGSVALPDMAGLITDASLYATSRYTAGSQFNVKARSYVYCTNSSFTQYIVVAGLYRSDGTLSNGDELYYAASNIGGKRTYNASLTDPSGGARLCQSIQGDTTTMTQVRWFYDIPTPH